MSGSLRKTDGLVFHPIEENDLDAILAIYNDYVEHSTATFHIGQVSKDTMRAIVNLNDPFYKTFVIEQDGEVCGYVLLTRYHIREAFRRSAEVTIYLAGGAVSKGIGSAALHFIEDIAVKSGLKVLLATICNENEASIALFEKNGYFQCAQLHHVAEKFGRLLDLLIFEKVLGQ